jgi:aerobic-type carbon monoxide dehydrogenase small subunit (CoxS/CutS family)
MPDTAENTPSPADPGSPGAAPGTGTEDTTATAPETHTSADTDAATEAETETPTESDTGVTATATAANTEPDTESDTDTDSDSGSDTAINTDDGTDTDTDADSEAGTATVPEAVDTEDEHPHVSYVLRVNGVDRPVASAWIGESLLYVLRERLGLAGAKDGCSQGECGACSVQVDGRLVSACLVPAATAAGSEVRTVEGLSNDGSPSDVQCALAESGSVQCGFCVPGLAMTVHDLLEGNHAPSELETRKAISGNLCRCSGYRGVLDAVRTVVEQRAAQAEREAAEAEAQAEAQAQAQSQAQAQAAAQAAAGPQPPGHMGYDQGEQQPAYDPYAPAPHDPHAQPGPQGVPYDPQGVPYDQHSQQHAPYDGGYQQAPQPHQPGWTEPAGYDEGVAYGGAPYEHNEHTQHNGGAYDPHPHAHIPHQTRHSENGGES